MEAVRGYNPLMERPADDALDALKAGVGRRYERVRPYLDRRQCYFWAAAEAIELGPAGVALAAAATGLWPAGIRASIHDFDTRPLALPAAFSSPPPVRPGAGRKHVETKDPEIIPALERMVTDEVAGEPMTEQRWVRSSLRHLSKRLADEGHRACTHTVAKLLRQIGFSLKVNKKRQAGSDCPGRDEQFEYIAAKKREFLGAGMPVVSVDAKKKELIGAFKNDGKVWCRQAPEIDEHGFASGASCVAVPFGVYDLARNSGFVVVGTSFSTSEFAVSAIANWWQHQGQTEHPNCAELLILADGGGSNGYKSRGWKKYLQEILCDRLGLAVTVCHYPTGCSKWNPVEYRLFSQISINWAGRPLRTLDVMLGYIRGTTTVTGLKVAAVLDTVAYKDGQKVTRAEFKQLRVGPHDVCPRWNYTIEPRDTAGHHSIAIDSTANSSGSSSSSAS
jgi:hypothetical protein